MELRPLSEAELKETKGGEAITLAAIMALLAIGVVTIICYKFFISKSGKATLPGGFTFQWN
ncbi:MAG: hypothetical protein WCR56_03165 [Bacilli bacterium]|jgi:hypothetical protein